MKLGRRFWWFHVFLGSKLETRGGFIETGGRVVVDSLKPGAEGPRVSMNSSTARAPGFNEYHHGVSSFNPQKHVNTAKLVARVSLNTGQKKKNMRVFHLKPCFSHFLPNFSSEYHPLISHCIPSTGENSLFVQLVYIILLLSLILSTAG